MHLSNLSRFVHTQFAPPKYLAMPTFGVDLSAGGVKVALPTEHLHGLELGVYGEGRLSVNAMSGGELADKAEIVTVLRDLKRKYHVEQAYVALAESRGYLFEASVEGTTKEVWHAEVEKHIEEYVPLPPGDIVFDIALLAQEGNTAHIVGIGYARRVIEETLSVFEESGIRIAAVSSETFALPRALLPFGDTSTVLIIDIGRTSTKLLVTSHGIPRLATTLDIGGHALTLAVQKYFGVTEDEARRVKAEKGLVPGPGSEEYVAAMLSTLSVIREEIVRRFDYWESRKAAVAAHESISRVLLTGGNATIRGLPEYLETALKVPVELANVFTNFASPDDWLPTLEYSESLGYGTAIGLSLRKYVV